MPVSVQRLPDEPIIVATLVGEITLEDVKEVYKTTHELIGDEPGIFHRITDTTQATSNFMDMLQMIQVATQSMPSSTQAANIRVTFVGTTHWINFLRNAFQKRGVTMGAFEEMDDALAAVRLQIESPLEEK